jgi:hypothetical protein
MTTTTIPPKRAPAPALVATQKSSVAPDRVTETETKRASLLGQVLELLSYAFLKSTPGHIPRR